MKRFWVLATVMSVAAWQPERVGADVFELVTGVAPGTSPGAPRSVNPSSFPTGGVPGSFRDGQRLGGTPSAAATAFGGVGTPFFNPNQFGSLSFMYRRGSVPIPAGPGVTLQAPVMAIDYLGGPQLDLDGDLNNGSRSLTPRSGPDPGGQSGPAQFRGAEFLGQRGEPRRVRRDRQQRGVPGH
jgi:hypothetical protein